MLCVVGCLSYGLQDVMKEQQDSAPWRMLEPTATQPTSMPVIAPMQSMRHTFTSTATYNPSMSSSVLSAQIGSLSNALPTYSGGKMYSYGGSVGHSAMGNVVAHAPQVAVAVPMAQVNPLAQRTAVVQPMQVAPRQNRMLAQGRAQAMGNYGKRTANGSTSGTYAGSGPMKAPPTMGGTTWQSWYDAYLEATGKGFVTEGDQADFLAWWNANYGGDGYGPNTWDDFWSWIPKGEAVPVTDGMYVLLILLLGYVVYKKRVCNLKTA